MRVVIFLTWLVVGSAVAFGVAPPSAGHRYGGELSLSGRSRQPESVWSQHARDTAEACRVVHRALYAVDNYWPEIFAYFGTRGANFSVLHANRAFYRDRLRNRFAACTNGKIRFRAVGRCGTSRETLAYVRVPFGFVIPVINLCDEFFALERDSRVSVIVHEFGRLEGIGDSPRFDTDNINVWDAVVGRTGGRAEFEAIAALAAKRPR